jgi:hypothetical protein
MLTNFNAKDLQQWGRFPSEALLATLAVLIRLAPPASPRFLGSLQKNRKYRADLLKGEYHHYVQRALPLMTSPFFSVEAS